MKIKKGIITILMLFCYCLIFSQIDTTLKNSLIKKAELSYNNEDYLNAYENFHSALILDSSDYNLLVRLSRCSILLNNPEQGVFFASKAIILDSNNLIAYFLRGVSYSMTHNYKEAISDYNIFLKDSSNIGYIGARGECYYYLGMYKEALRDFDCYLKIKPKDLLNRYNRTEINAALGNLKDIIADVDYIYSNPIKKVNAQLTNEQLYKLLYFRGSAYFYLSQFDKAISDLETYCELTPSDLKALEFLGKAYYMKGDYEKAENCFTKICKQDPKFPGALYFLGNIEFLLQKYQKSLEHYTEFQKTSTKIVDKFYTDYAQVKYLTGDTLGCTKELEHLSKLDSSYIIPVKLLQIYYGYENPNFHKQSIENLNYLILHTKNTDSLSQMYQLRGIIHYKSNSNQWETDFEKAISLTPNEASIYTNLSYIHFLQKDNPKALKLIDKAIYLNPKEYNGYYIKSIYFIKMNQKNEACKCMKEAYKVTMTVESKAEINCFCSNIENVDCANTPLNFVTSKGSIFRIENIYHNGENFTKEIMRDIK